MAALGGRGASDRPPEASGVDFGSPFASKNDDFGAIFDFSRACISGTVFPRFFPLVWLEIHVVRAGREKSAHALRPTKPNRFS